MTKRVFLLVLALVVVCGRSTLPARAANSVAPATLPELDKAVGSKGKGALQSRNDTKIVVGEDRELAGLPLMRSLDHIARKTIGRWVAPARKAIAKAKYAVAAKRLEKQIKKFAAMKQTGYTVDMYGKDLNLDAAIMQSHAQLKISNEDLRRLGQKYKKYVDFKRYTKEGPLRMRERLQNAHAPEP